MNNGNDAMPMITAVHESRHMVFIVGRVFHLLLAVFLHVLAAEMAPVFCTFKNSEYF